MQLNLKVWRQKSDKEKGNFELYTVDNVLDIVKKGKNSLVVYE